MKTDLQTLSELHFSHSPDFRMFRIFVFFGFIAFSGFSHLFVFLYLRVFRIFVLLLRICLPFIFLLDTDAQ